MKVAVLVGLSLSGAPAARSATLPGEVERRDYPQGYRSVIYAPSSLDGSRPAPLVVFLHGCNQTAEHIHAEGDIGAQAEAGKFVALYPDFDPARRSLPCWQFRAHTTRSSGDPAAVAAMVSDSVARPSPRIDPLRVYVAGLSSGAMMTTILGAAYPDLFAGLAVDAGCAYRAVSCIGAAPSRRTETLALEALRAMGPRKRVLPMLIMHGDHDATVPVAHSGQLLEQWRRTNNLVASGRPNAPIPARPARVHSTTLADGRVSTVEHYEDALGRTVIERWTVHGLGHDWLFAGERPGAAAIMWSFFNRIALGARGSARSASHRGDRRRGAPVP